MLDWTEKCKLPQNDEKAKFHEASVSLDQRMPFLKEVDSVKDLGIETVSDFRWTDRCPAATQRPEMNG